MAALCENKQAVYIVHSKSCCFEIYENPIGFHCFPTNLTRSEISRLVVERGGEKKGIVEKGSEVESWRWIRRFHYCFLLTEWKENMNKEVKISKKEETIRIKRERDRDLPGRRHLRQRRRRRRLPFARARDKVARVAILYYYDATSLLARWEGAKSLYVSTLESRWHKR